MLAVGHPRAALLVASAALVAGTFAGCGAGDDDPKTKPSASSTPSTSDSPLAANPFGGDKSWIAYQTARSGVEAVWLVRPDGTEDHQVATDLPNALLPDWSPDGTHLVLASRGDGQTEEPLFEYDVAADSTRQLFECTAPCLGDDEPVYSPDGSEVAFIRGLRPIKNGLPADCSLWIGDRATGEVRQVTSNTEPQCDREYNPRWSPDGEQLTYWRQPSMDGATTVTAAYVVNADGTGERRLTDPAMEAGESDWSPDGEWIVFATHPLAQFDAGEESHLFRIRPDGTGLEQLTDFTSAELRATQPQFTPDGEWIVFTAVTPSTRSLWAIPAEGGAPVEIAAGGIYTHGTWQPGSESSAATADGIDGVVQIDGGRGLYVRCTGTGSPTVILEGGDEDTSDSYGFAESALAESTRTCVYDRANLGRSDPDPGPRDLPELVADLEGLLEAAEIPGPYVLVGTSGGGYISAGYAYAHPDEVAGMVFVEVPPPFRNPPQFLVDVTTWDHPENIENRNYLEVEKDAWAARRRIGEIPVTVISNEYSADEIAAAEFPEEQAGMRTNVQGQRGWLVLSPLAEQLIVHTGHAVEEEDPDLVLQAILDVVEAARR